MREGKKQVERAKLTDLLMGFAGLNEHVFVWCAKNKELWLHNENSINHWTHHRSQTPSRTHANYPVLLSAKFNLENIFASCVVFSIVNTF